MVNWFRNFWHRLMHIFKLNTGRVVTWRDDQYVYVGFQCDGCGSIDEKTIDKITSVEIFEKGEYNEHR